MGRIEKRPIDDAKAMGVIESDVNPLYEYIPQGLQGLRGPRVQTNNDNPTNQTVGQSMV